MIESIDLSRVKVGDKLKDYGEFCQLLDLDKKSGTRGKKLQLNELKDRFLMFHKEGRSFVIDEVYKEPKEFERKSRSGRYSDLGKPIIMSLLRENTNYEWDDTQNNLFIDIGMANINSKKMAFEKKNICMDNHIDGNTFDDVVKVLNDLRVGALMNMLSTLKHEGLIEYNFYIAVTLLNDDIVFEAKRFEEWSTDEIRMKLYDDAQNEVIQQMGEKNMWDCQRKYKMNEYIVRFNEYIKKEYYWKSAQKRIHISLTDRGCEEVDKYLKDVDVFKTRKKLNEEVIKRINEVATIKAENALHGQVKSEGWGDINKMDIKPFDLHRVSDNYRKDINRLVELYVKI